jgi:hypothetical protein
MHYKRGIHFAATRISRYVGSALAKRKLAIFSSVPAAALDQ